MSVNTNIEDDFVFDPARTRKDRKLFIFADRLILLGVTLIALGFVAVIIGLIVRVSTFSVTASANRDGWVGIFAAAVGIAMVAAVVVLIAGAVVTGRVKKRTRSLRSLLKLTNIDLSTVPDETVWEAAALADDYFRVHGDARRAVELLVVDPSKPSADAQFARAEELATRIRTLLNGASV